MISESFKVIRVCVLTGIFMLTSIQVSSQVNLQWLKRYNPKIQGGNWTDAVFLHIDVDDEGSAYICGPSQNYTYGSDIITIKYNADGEQVWQSCYNSSTPTDYLSDSPGEMVVDHNKNVIVAGSYAVLSGPTYAVALLIKYSPEGDTLWTRKFKEVPGFYNVFKDVLVDSRNNIYVTGQSYMSTADYECVTIKYDEDGNQQWIAKHDYYKSLEIVNEICFDPAENYFYMTSHSGYTAAILKLIKYECSSGDTLWTRNIPAVGFANVITDHSGNIYVSATVSQTYPYKGDMALSKYTPEGELLWFETFGCPGYGSDTPRDIKVDADNNVYITGVSHLYATPYTQGDPNWTTIKYNPAGEVQWSRFYNRGYPDPWAIALPCALEFDKEGNILVAGYACEKNLLSSDYVLLKYGKETGKTLDTFIYLNISGGPSGDLPNEMALDKNGNIFITGTMWTDSTSSYDFGTMRLTPQANATSLTFEKDSLVKPISDLHSTFDTIRVNTGSFKSTAYLISDVNVTIDSVYHTNDSDLEFYLIHEGITDTLIYCKGSGSANFKRTILDDSSPLILSEGSAPYYGTYKPGSVLSAFNQSDPNGDWVLKIYDNKTGNTGTLYGWKLQLRMSLITGIEPAEIDLSRGSALLQNYPNPFNLHTKIEYRITDSGLVNLKVYDWLGRVVATLVYELKPSGKNEVEFDGSGLPAGVYFYQLRVNGMVETKKMLHLK